MLGMFSPCLHGFSPGSPVLFYCPKSSGWGTGALASSLQLRSVLPLCMLAMCWGCDASRLSHASEVDEWTRSCIEMRGSSCYTLVPLDGSKHHTNSPTIVFCFSFLTAHDKLFTFYSLPVTHFTFYQLLRYCQGDIIRTWCNLWCIQYELQTFF